MKFTLTMTVAFLITTVIALAADSTLGTWKMNAEKSKQASGVPPITSLTVVREAADGGVKTTAKGERPDGSKIDIIYTAKYDGKDVPVTGTGTIWDTTSIKQVDNNTLAEERTRKGGKYHTNVRHVVSNGGKVMTSTSNGTGSDGKALMSIIVFDKQ
jgi:hypothetical protein